MLVLSRSPHGDKGSEDLLEIKPVIAFRHLIRKAVERDQRASAGRIGRGEQRRRCERPVDREEDRFVTPEIVQTPP